MTVLRLICDGRFMNDKDSLDEFIPAALFREPELGYRHLAYIRIATPRPVKSPSPYIMSHCLIDILVVVGANDKETFDPFWQPFFAESEQQAHERVENHQSRNQSIKSNSLAIGMFFEMLVVLLLFGFGGMCTYYYDQIR